jgi:hypothetical protein
LHRAVPAAWRGGLVRGVQISTVIARLSRDSEDLLDDYRFWRERDPELKS